MSARNYHYADFVRPAGRDDYDRAIDDRLQWLRRQPGLVAVYSIGSVGHPGISDIDMVAVFEDDARVDQHPLTGLDPVSRYLFVHTLYGAGRSDFGAAQRYSFYQNYRLLHGDELRQSAAEPSSSDRDVIQRQIAFEFMLRMYISLFLQKEYRLLRLRTLLLHGKGLLHDARTLKLSGMDWIVHLEELMQLRDSWFTLQEGANNAALAAWFDRFEPSYTAFLESYLAPHRFEVPAPEGFPYARNIRILPSSVLRASRSGLRIPFGKALLGRKYFNFLNRFNTCTFYVPYSPQVSDPRIAEYYHFTAGLRQRTAERLPGFFALTSAFRVKDMNT